MPTNKRSLVLTLVAFAAIDPAQAQNPTSPPAKKLYCWDENGTRVCGDALPADAVNRAREEFNARTGTRTAEVQRVQTAEERAAAAIAAEQKRADDAAAETRRRTEQALLNSYATEDELRRVFNDRTGIVQNNVETARFNIASLRDGLVTLLQSAAERELSGKPVPAQLSADIRARHAELLQQLRLEGVYARQRVELHAEIEQVMARYREMKGIAPPAAPATTAPPAAEATAPVRQ